MNPAGLPLGHYVPGPSPIHNVGPGLKLLSLVIFIVVVTWFNTSWWVLLIAACLLSAGYALAHVPVNVGWNQFRPLLPILILLGAFQWWQNSWQYSLSVTIGLALSVMAACLVTLTTTIPQLVSAIENAVAPLGKLGVPVGNVSLALMLTIRVIPLEFKIIHDVMEARAARGAGWSIRAVFSPVLIRSIKKAQDLSEALWARGAE